MFTVDTLLRNILDSGITLSHETLNELELCENIPSIFKVLVTNLKLDDDTIQYINTNLIMSLSTIGKNCINCSTFIIESNNVLWDYILEYFDDNQLSSLIVTLYLCIVNTRIKVEYILKLYGILFSELRSLEIMIEMETFYDEKGNPYVNNYNTFLGIVMNRISVTETNYDSRVQKLSDIFMKLIKNGESKPKFLSWLGGLINSSRNFKNNFVFNDNYDKNTIHPRYFRLVMNVLMIFWDNCKKKKVCKYENLNMEYYKHKDSIINLDEKTVSDKIENKFMNDVFFTIIGIVSIFYNNLVFMENQYKTIIDDLKIQYRQLQLTGFCLELKEKYINKITKCQLELTDIEYCYHDKKTVSLLKNFQKDLGDILNSKLKNNVYILDMILETNIDLINSFKIYEDSLFNYNFVNFENSIILINYQKLKNPYIRYKYSYFSSYYITDNKSRNVCDLRFKTIENILIPNLLQFYLDMEDHSDDSFYEKPMARWTIINFLNFVVFKEPYIYGVQIEKYGKNLDTKFIRFVNLYINDLSGFFDETFELIRQINQMESDNIYVSLNENEDNYIHMEKHYKLLKKYQNLGVNLDFLKGMFNFLVILSENCQNILLSKELGVKYCSQINYYMNEITCKTKRKYYNIKNKYDVGFLPMNLLEFLTKIILSCSNNKNFIEFMAKDTRSFKNSNIKFAIEKLYRNHLITQSEFNKIELIGEDIEKKMKSEENVDYPDEFCDPLLACEICEPVILPDTDIIMEKSVISRHLLTDLHNPFNREPLTLEKLEEFNNLESNKKIVKLFLARKEIWRKNNS